MHEWVGFCSCYSQVRCFHWRTWKGRCGGVSENISSKYGGIGVPNTPRENAKLALPKDLPCPPENILDKTVIFESTIKSNEDQSTLWATEGIVVAREFLEYGEAKEG